MIAKWDPAEGGAPARYLYWIMEAPSYLALGIVAIVIEVFFRYTEIETRAYPLRIIIIVSALSIPLKYRRFLLPGLTRLRKEGKVGEEKWIGEATFKATGAGVRSVSDLLSMNAQARSLLVASYILESAIWTWLVIHYRYYSQSFLGQSSWVMFSLWLHLASGWAFCVGLFVYLRSSTRLANSEARQESMPMRFRANVSLLPCLLAGYVCVYAFDSFRSRSLYPPWRVSLVALLILTICLSILTSAFTYWELDTAHLRRRRLWRVKEIAWQDVTRVGRFGFSGKKVKINYGRVPEDYAYILADPSNCERFIEALRRFATHAEFDV
jgi:hypothetical protein